MHGSSSVPQDLQDLFTAYGGEMKQTWGVPVSEIQKAIPLGVRKVNIDTDLRLAMTATIRKCFREKPTDFDPRTYLKPSTALMSQVCRDASKPSAPPATPRRSASSAWPKWPSSTLREEAAS